ncbi:MAG: hypothetical protein K8T89_10125 [Planctomycetes bacterium]|nr:hypothetical protein [Planctomycetota bacterium]
MKQFMGWLQGVTLAAGLALTSTSQGQDIRYIENFALAKDRAESLKQLIPGTEDYYYFHCLHFLNNEQFDKIEALITPWAQRHGQTAKLTEIQTRHALLAYDKNPQQTLNYLKGRLGLNYNHQKETVGTAPNLPTSLDQAIISRERLKAYSLAPNRHLENFEDVALDWLAAEPLSYERRRILLQRLQRPDIANLVKLIVDDLNSPHAGEFGGHPIDFQLTLDQLEELVKQKPGVLNQNAFVRTYLTKLQPGADDDWKRDRKLTLAYLERLQKFVDRLDPVHNALKAHVMFHRLAFDRAQDIYNLDRFNNYIKLPRFQSYMARTFNERVESTRHPADLNADFTALTLLPRIGMDEPLVRSYLKHFFADAESPKFYETWIDDVYLRHLFAETKIELGQGDAETWASKLPPELYRQLKDRIDIDFAFTNKTDFAADEPVVLDLFVKNVSTMLVKVYEINTRTLYRSRLQEIDTDINLDGLVANSERTIKYDDPPLSRQARKFDFPGLNKPGIYVIDFIGSGKSSRALIRKGRLRPLVVTGTAGQSIRVIDDQNKPVSDATVWLSNIEYKADKDGLVIVPFTAAPGRRPIVISRGDFASLDFINHEPEQYRLAAGIHVDRESLITQKVAPVLIRPGLFLNNIPVSLKLLEEVNLRITSVDHSGIPSSVDVPNFKLFEDRESVHEIRVPARLHTLSITLTAKVRNLASGKLVDLVATRTFGLNEIERTDKIEDLHFAKFGANYTIELLGRSGEAKPDRPIQLAFKHRDFKEQVHTTLKTDAQGRVNLGALLEIVSVTATGPEGTAHTWVPSIDRHTFRQLIHAQPGEAITLPYLGTQEKASHEEFALFEVLGSNIRADKFDALAIHDGVLELRGLTAGDYDLYQKRNGERIRIRVVDGVIQTGHVLGTTRHMQMPGLKPLHIQSIKNDADAVVIHLRDATKYARVHVFATRYQPAFPVFSDLARVRDSELGGVLPGHAESVYLTGRNIGDEYRYVLDRRGQKKHPGNMLDRPSILLNPWAVRTTETGEQLAAGGDQFGRGGGFNPAAPLAPPKPQQDASNGWQPGAAGEFSNLDFLAEATAIGLNLIPDRDGNIKVALKEIGSHSMIHIVAVDPLSTTVRSITLPEQKTEFVDLRLKNGLDPSKHFTQQKQVSVVGSGQAFAIADIVGSRFQMYDSLPKVYSFYSTLSKDPNLAEFNFILTWPKLKPEEKRALYSKFACHELHFFLFKKDPQFFADVIKPYLRNKKDKTFLDFWLLGDEVTRFMQPWEYGRLNSVERVLLAQRIAGEPDKAARHLNDLLRLLPPNLDRQLFLFNVGVDSGGLKSDDATVGLIREEQTKRLEEARRDRVPGEAPDPRAESKPNADMAVPTAGMGGPSAKSPPRPGRENAKKSGKTTESGDKDKSDTDSKEGEMLNKVLADEKYFDDAIEKRKAVRQLFRKLDPTQEWAENNYYKKVIQLQVAGLIPAGDFWYDYARHDRNSPFLSLNLADASRNFTEMMFALSVIDLPFEAGKHDVKFDGSRMMLTAGSPMIAFHEEVRPADGKNGQIPILISQNFYRNGDRFREENGEKYDKFVTAEFVVHTVYGCQVVVTNPTSSRQKLTVLVQLPVGAIPVANGQFTRSVLLDLEPYRTQTVDYLFYFPKAGKYGHFPVQVAKNEQFITAAPAFTFEVVEKPTKLDTTSWDFVSQNGTDEDVLAFLNRENVRALNLEKIAFRMKDRPFFEVVTKLLNERHLFQPTLWSYGLQHGDVNTASQFLLHSDQLVAECGGPLESILLKIDPVARHQYEHLEYKPLVNARAHSLGRKRQIVNDTFNNQYHKLMTTLSYRKQLDDADCLAVTYYLLLQDRITEAENMFGLVNPAKIATKMQYDYCAAYLEMFNDDPKKARSIVAKYVNYPVDRWKNTFASILAQLDEIEGKVAKVVDPLDRAQQQEVLAATEPGFEFTLDNKAIQLTWQNLDTVKVNYYLMDVELLFSRNPFVQQSGSQFASIRPNFTREIKLPNGQTKMAIPLPDDLVKRNVLVEVVAAGKTHSAAYYANAMEVKFTENYGQVRVVSDQAKPLQKVYVKVYAKLADGSVKFHKDGYTDLRGRFDYVSVNTPERQAIERFAVLVLSEDSGALIRDVAPPQR